MMKSLLPSVLAGLVLFFWGFVSHALLPWYDPAFHPFADEAAMSTALERNAPEKGLYYLPFAETDRGSGQVEAFVNVVPAGEGVGGGMQIGLGLVIAVVSAFLGVTLVRRTEPATRLEAVVTFALVGLAIGFVSHAYYWNWFQFPASYVVVAIVDSLVGWTLAGVAVAGFVASRSDEPR